MENLFEDVYGDIKRKLDNTKRRMGMNSVDRDLAKYDPDTIISGSNFDNGKIYIDEEFCRRFISYLEIEIDKSFPNQSQLKSVLNYELKKLIKTGNDKELIRVVSKMRDIVIKEKMKFFDSVFKKISAVSIDKN